MNRKNLSNSSGNWTKDALYKAYICQNLSEFYNENWETFSISETWIGGETRTGRTLYYPFLDPEFFFCPFDFDEEPG
jgi:hypothetical protein